MVVITIISFLLVFTLPVFKNPGFFTTRSQETQNLIELIQSLKLRSKAESNDFHLHIDTRGNRIWVTNGTMGKDEKQRAENETAKVLNRVEITGVEFPDQRPSGPEPVVISFSKNGYSDMVKIHMGNGEEALTLTIQPFLPKVLTSQGYISFDDCT